jgi:hypothetical protein
MFVLFNWSVLPDLYVCEDLLQLGIIVEMHFLFRQNKINPLETHNHSSEKISCKSLNKIGPSGVRAPAVST